jgi:nucleoside-diphosphate-sugar epimerase
VKAAVTGATGFVGGPLVAALRARGDEVACLVRSPEKAAELAKSGARLVKGTLEDEAALRTLAEGADIFYHVAGAVTSAGRPGALDRVNRQGTETVVGAVRAAGVRRLLYVSSLAASGPATTGAPLPDASQARPVTDYGRSKVAAEAAVRAGGVPFTIVRPPAIYGPGDRQFLPAFQMARWGLGPVLGGGRQELSLVHVRDLAEALVAAATSETAAGHTYHAAHAEVVTQRELVRGIGQAVGRTHTAIVPVPKPALVAIAHVSGLMGDRTVLRPEKLPELLAPAWTCASDALAADAGWSARIALAEGLPETARWYREVGWL